MESNQPPVRSKKTIVDLVNELFSSIGESFRKLIDLEDGLDRDGTVIAIKSGKRMKGANAWLLMCSIMIASLGLDLNSPAVIIGAMLISPLMAPILGIGLSIATNDREALIISLQHFGIAIAIALFTSTAYFLITPLGEITDEIRARTAPTLLDGLVAIFGGLAGIISTTRRDKSSAIPGVAIATALMPPLCVTGYGIATWKIGIMMNSFYLFFLNSFFIAITAFLIIRLLNFDRRSYLDKKDARRSRWIIAIVSLILVIPSANILLNLLEDRKRDTQIQEFVNEYFNKETNLLRRCQAFTFIEGDTSSHNQLIIQLFGKDIPEDSLDFYNERLAEFGIANTKLEVIQETDIRLETISDMQLELRSLGQITEQLENAQKVRTTQEKMIEQLTRSMDSLQRSTIPFQQVSTEAKALFPQLTQIGYGTIQQTNFDQPIIEHPVFMVNWARNKKSWEITRDEKRLQEFLKVRTPLDTIILIRY